jgi:hypothetical protein
VSSSSRYIEFSSSTIEILRTSSPTRETGTTAFTTFHFSTWSSFYSYSSSINSRGTTMVSLSTSRTSTNQHASTGKPYSRTDHSSDVFSTSRHTSSWHSPVRPPPITETDTLPCLDASKSRHPPPHSSTPHHPPILITDIITRTSTGPCYHETCHASKHHRHQPHVTKTIRKCRNPKPKTITLDCTTTVTQCPTPLKCPVSSEPHPLSQHSRSSSSIPLGSNGGYSHTLTMGGRSSSTRRASLTYQSSTGHPTLHSTVPSRTSSIPTTSGTTTLPTCPHDDHGTYLGDLDKSYTIYCGRYFSRGESVDMQSQDSFGACIAACDLYNTAHFLNGTVECRGVSYFHATSQSGDSNCFLQGRTSFLVPYNGVDSAKLLNPRAGPDDSRTRRRRDALHDDVLSNGEPIPPSKENVGNAILSADLGLYNLPQATFERRNPSGNINSNPVSGCRTHPTNYLKGAAPSPPGFRKRSIFNLDEHGVAQPVPQDPWYV